VRNIFRYTWDSVAALSVVYFWIISSKLYGQLNRHQLNAYVPLAFLKASCRAALSIR
jgi:hypothetical protein